MYLFNLIFIISFIFFSFFYSYYRDLFIYTLGKKRFELIEHKYVPNLQFGPSYQ